MLFRFWLKRVRHADSTRMTFETDKRQYNGTRMCIPVPPSLSAVRGQHFIGTARLLTASYGLCISAFVHCVLSQFVHTRSLQRELKWWLLLLLLSPLGKVLT